MYCQSWPVREMMHAERNCEIRESKGRKEKAKWSEVQPSLPSLPSRVPIHQCQDGREARLGGRRYQMRLTGRTTAITYRIAITIVVEIDGVCRKEMRVLFSFLRPVKKAEMSMRIIGES